MWKWQRCDGGSEGFQVRGADEGEGSTFEYQAGEGMELGKLGQGLVGGK